MRPRNLRVRVAIFGGVSAVLVVAIVLLLALRARRAAIIDIQRQTLLTVEAFAQAAGAWISRGDLDTVSRVAELMLTGSSLYVQVIHGDTSLVERIDPSWQGLPPALRASSSLSGPSGRFRRDHSVWYVDVLIPLTTGELPQDTGYVRAGVDVGFVRAGLAASNLRAAGMGAVGWAVCLAAFFLLMRRSVRHTASKEPGEVRGAILHCDGLTIDTATVEVSLDGRPVRLTPKQFELLTLLAASRGRVISDQEIIARLWPDSPYADSNDVRQCVYKLRRRMNSVQPSAGMRIDNVKGFGYRLLGAEPEPTREPVKLRWSRLRAAHPRDEGGNSK